MHLRSLSGLCLYLWLLVCAGAATIDCRWRSGTVEIDGAANEPAWQAAHWIERFNILGSSNAPVTPTRAAFLWDDEALYFYAEMVDHDLFADVREHDGATWYNDVFEIFLQPDPAKPRYYEFEINALNTQFDMLITRTADMNADFTRSVKADTFTWKTAVALRGTLTNRMDRDSGWSVEGRMPWVDFKPTGGAPKSGDEWRHIFSRYDYVEGKRAELSTSVPMPSAGGFHQPPAWGTVRFVGSAAKAGWENKGLIGSPDPAPLYRAKRIYAGIKAHGPKTEEHEFYGPVAIHAEPGAQRLIFLENYGYSQPRTVLRRFEATPDASQSEMILQTDEHGYSFTFHPKFAENGYIFVGLNGKGAEGKNHTRIVRYTFEGPNKDRIRADSRKLIIEWPSSGHNGGDCVFGNDGMLYVTSGDGTSGMDPDDMGQNVGALLSKVLRIDVDGAAANEAYRVPVDNPFIGVAGVRPETWAYGLRNPWRISSDPKTGQIWVGDNGQDLYEFAFLIQRGANYGWSAFEGSARMFTNRLRGPSAHTLPTIQHDHGMFRSLTGGLVYRGKRFPELEGAYVYGDFATGRIWAMKHDGQKSLWHKELADTPLQIAGFGHDVDGELLVVDYGGGFYTLEENPRREEKSNFAQRLSDTGLFSNVANLDPAAGVSSYSINAPGWHDGARGGHWMALPANAKLHPTADGQWQIDDGVALVQTLTLGLGRAARRVETRVLLKQANDWAAYTYVWNESQTDAELANAAGRRVKVKTSEGDRDWLVPARSDCLNCHSRAANFALSINTRQLNRPLADKSEQLKALTDRGVLAGDIKAFSNPTALPRHHPISNLQASLEDRARTYLAVNCAHCHTSDGGGNSSLNVLPNLKLSDTHLFDAPQHGSFNLKDARIITPGNPARSVLMTRMALRIPGQMPPIGTLRPDTEAVRVLSSWIASLPPAEIGAK